MLKKLTFFIIASLLSIILISTISIKNTNLEVAPNTASTVLQETTTAPLKESKNTEDTYLVTRVIDGDTIEIEGGQKVRYIGIDTPETVDPRKPVQCFGVEASKKNKELVEGKRVRLEKDVSETDKYGRLLRYVYADDIFVNDYLVRQGYAYASTFPPDVKYQDKFVEAQKEARENNRGLWSACSGLQQTTISLSPINSSSNSQCLIKGNINSEGEKIYHLPDCPDYEKTKIDESRGERWFCTEEEAIKAGWRKALNCS
ncbi:MAG: thermonuclease family protein [Parcubacteria group bacterium]|nr:thermonuclease family protein [Parcubacteria group bacterium]